MMNQLGINGEQSSHNQQLNTLDHIEHSQKNQVIPRIPSLQLLDPSILGEMQWLGNALTYNDLYFQQSSKAGLLTTSNSFDQMSHGGSLMRHKHIKPQHLDGHHQQSYDSGWELKPVRQHANGKDMKFKLGLLNLKTDYYPQYMVSKHLDAEALIQVDVVQGQIYITSCPHHWKDNTEREEEEYKKTSSSYRLASLLSKEVRPVYSQIISRAIHSSIHSSIVDNDPEHFFTFGYTLFF